MRSEVNLIVCKFVFHMIPYREIVGFKNVLEVISLPVFLNMSLKYYDLFVCRLCIQSVIYMI